MLCDLVKNNPCIAIAIFILILIGTILLCIFVPNEDESKKVSEAFRNVKVGG